MSGDAVVVCQRQDSLLHPIKGSTTERCVECRELVWLSPATKTIKDKWHAEPVCVVCISETFGGEVNVEPLSPEQEKELET